LSERAFYPDTNGESSASKDGERSRLACNRQSDSDRLRSRDRELLINPPPFALPRAL